MAEPRSAALKKRVCKATKELLNKGDPDAVKKSTQSVGGETLLEGLPMFVQLPCEDVIEGQNNAYIVLGRDRPSGQTSGYIDNTQAGSIDLVVGRMGADVIQCEVNGKTLWVHPMFNNDAGRIYISQKTDIDKNFKIAAGSIGSPGYEKALGISGVPDANPASGIAIKADDIRIIARRGIKIVTEVNTPTAQNRTPTRTIDGVDIIAGNKSQGKFFNIQPMVKGKNLRESLERVVERFEELKGIVEAFLIWQNDFNIMSQMHFHKGMDGATILPQSPTLLNAGSQFSMNAYEQGMQSLKNFQANLGSFKTLYLKQTSDKYICSRWNHVN